LVDVSCNLLIILNVFSVVLRVYSQFFLQIQVYYGWRKATEEFIKRMDPDFPFYYHTSGHRRYYTDLMPDFCTKPAKPKKPSCIPRYELLGASNRITLAVHGESSVCTKFHNIPVDHLVLKTKLQCMSILIAIMQINND